MPQPIHLPKVGMTMEEGTLAKWRVPDGAVKRGDVIFDMETEKVEMEIEAEADGALKQAVAEGTTSSSPATSSATSSRPAKRRQPARPQPRQARQHLPRPLLPPQARRRLVPPAPRAPHRSRAVSHKETGIDLASITGTGPDGRIVERDVNAAIEAKQAAPAAAASASGAIPYAGRRRTIGERMLQSVTSMAQLTLTSEVRVDEALKMIHGLNREWRTDRVVVTLTALIVKASALALREHPVFNSRLANDQILAAPRINVGVAVDVDAGLMVPVVYDADKVPLKKVSQELRDLSQRARDDKLTPDDVTGGTFTISSLEGTAVDVFTPVINPPQAAILGVGRVREVAVFEGAEVMRAQATTLSLTFDHRVADGAPAARFLGRIAELLERPYLLM